MSFNPENWLRTVHFDPYYGHGEIFAIQLFDTNEQDRMGKSRLAYKLVMYRGETPTVVFQGDDFFCPPHITIDGDRSIASLMSFLTLRKGDVESDYFDGYNSVQVEFRDNHAESIE